MSENTESTNAPAIYGQLAQVMADCTHVAKRDRNEHQRFLFRGIDAVVNAVGPILREHKVIVLPQVRDVTYEQVATSGGKASTACRVLVDYVFVSGVDGSTLTASAAPAPATAPYGTRRSSPSASPCRPCPTTRQLPSP